MDAHRNHGYSESLDKDIKLSSRKLIGSSDNVYYFTKNDGGGVWGFAKFGPKYIGKEGAGNETKWIYCGIGALEGGRGRCWACASAAIVSMIKNDNFNHFDIAMAAASYGVGMDGHYFAVVGVPKKGHSLKGKSESNPKDDWDYCFKVDIWEACGNKHIEGYRLTANRFFKDTEVDEDTRDGFHINTPFLKRDRLKHRGLIREAEGFFRKLKIEREIKKKAFKQNARLPEGSASLQERIRQLKAAQRKK